ncbi:mitogen-activated protein kinase-binding protein 1 [Chiloscyllium plagiosum]|uniref:mitogen-activated protein kinase-binding protein 1 n=1 Tax=Chiloscyllium plagiosum TaxID=36176 RepID=UPI001CB7F48D|nr:mitogen-activated protein kinase-binding protein 1 [Chiloscyllium plagiosum]
MVSHTTVTLEKVLGITVSGSSGLACDSKTGLVAYPSGCVVVLFNPKKNKQHHILNGSRKTITALAFSPDGKYLVTGESGHMPAVRIWDANERTQVAELQEHKYGVACVAFSPNAKYIVSVGYQHDMIVNVWAWKKNVVVAANKVSSKVTAVSFSEDSSYFVTAGNRHVKFWYLDASKASKVNATVPLLGRSGLLGELRNNFFSDVACGRSRKADSTFCITTSGLLCEFSDKRLLDKWVELRNADSTTTTMANCLSVSEDFIFCGCADGTVRLFNPANLHFIATMPKPHHLGMDIAAATEPSHLFSTRADAKYPDTIALTYDPTNRWLSCVYNDHSLYVWDVKDFKKVGKVYSALYHASCVWSVEVYPEVEDSNRACLPPGSFITCSSDNTLRLWNTEGSSTHGSSLHRNMISSDLLKVLYMDSNTSTLLDVENNSAGGSDKPDGQAAEMKTGIRTLCVSPDGQHMASGDRAGTLRVHDLQLLRELLQVEAHDSEILCLEYSKPETGTLSVGLLKLLRIFNISNGKQKKLYKGSQGEDGTLIKVQIDPSGLFIATSCSDKNLSIFDFYTGECVATMFGHSEVVTGMKFTNDCKHLISVSGDSCIFIWRLSSELTINMRQRLAEIKQKEKKQMKTPPQKHSSPNRRETFDVAAQTAMSSDSEKEAEDDGNEEDEGHCEGSARITPKRGMTANVANDIPTRIQYTGSMKSLYHWENSKAEDVAIRLDSMHNHVPRPRGRWSRHANNLELSVKSMLDLRNLDSFSFSPLTDSAPRAGTALSGSRVSEEASDHERRVRISIETLLSDIEEQESTDAHNFVRPCSIAIPTCEEGIFSQELETPEVEERTIYPVHTGSTGETEGEYQVKELQHGTQEKPYRSHGVLEKHSPDSACSVDYSSSHFSSPEHPHEDSECTEPLSVDGISSDMEEEEEELSRSFPRDTTVPRTPDQEQFLKQHFGTLADESIGVKSDRRLDYPKPLFAKETEELLNPRLSISARFLSQSLASSFRKSPDISSKAIQQSEPRSNQVTFPGSNLGQQGGEVFKVKTEDKRELQKQEDLKNDRNDDQKPADDLAPNFSSALHSVPGRTPVKAPFRTESGAVPDKSVSVRAMYGQRKRNLALETRKVFIGGSVKVQSVSAHPSPAVSPSATMRKSQSVHDLIHEVYPMDTASNVTSSEKLHSHPLTITEKDSRVNQRRTLPLVPSKVDGPVLSLAKDSPQGKSIKQKSYMNPTTSSMAKMSRSVSMGDSLNFTESGEDQSITEKCVSGQCLEMSPRTSPVVTVDVVNEISHKQDMTKQNWKETASSKPVLQPSAGLTVSSANSSQAKLSLGTRANLFLDLPKPLPDRPSLTSFSPSVKVKSCCETEPFKSPVSANGGTKWRHSCGDGHRDSQEKKGDTVSMLREETPALLEHQTQGQCHQESQIGTALLSPCQQVSSAWPRANSEFRGTRLVTEALDYLPNIPVSNVQTVTVSTPATLPSVFPKTTAKGPGPSVSVQSCKLLARELQSCFERALTLYRTVADNKVSSDENNQMTAILSETFSFVRKELDCLQHPGRQPGSPPQGPGQAACASCPVGSPPAKGDSLEDEKTLALLEQYSERLLQAVERRMDHKQPGGKGSAGL